MTYTREELISLLGEPLPDDGKPLPRFKEVGGPDIPPRPMLKFGCEGREDRERKARAIMQAMRTEPERWRELMNALQEVSPTQCSAFENEDGTWQLRLCRAHGGRWGAAECMERSPRAPWRGDGRVMGTGGDCHGHEQKRGQG